MISCDVTDIMKASQCFQRCIPDGMHLAVQVYLLCQIGNGFSFSPPSDSAWNLETADESIFVTGFPAFSPDPSVNSFKVRYRVQPSTTWLFDDVDVNGQGDAVDTIQPGQTVEVQVAWAVVTFNPPSNTQVSDWSSSKYSTYTP